MKILYLTLSILTFLSLQCSISSAISFQSSDAIAIPSTQVINDDLAVAGNSVSIAGKTLGELFAAGSSISFTGETANSSLLAGSQVSSSGFIGGSLRILSSSATISSKIKNDLMVAAGQTVIGPEAKIGRDLLVASGTFSLPAPVGRNVFISAGDAQISSIIGGNAWVNAERLTLLPGAVIKGDLRYRGNKLDIRPGATVKGKIINLPLPAGAKKAKKSGFNWIWTVLSTIALLAFGTVLTAIFPKFLKTASGNVFGNFGQCLGWGALTAIIGLFAIITAFILTFTLILAPITLSFLSIYWIVVYSSFIVAGAAVGGAILRRSGKSIMTEMLLGTAIVGIAVTIPFIGWIIWLAAAFLGLGAMAVYIRRLQTPSLANSQTVQTDPPAVQSPPDIEI